MRKGDFKDPLLKFCAGIELHGNGCWLWGGGKTNNGYGTINVFGKTRLVHRWSYEHFRKPIENGLHLDHLCRVRNCANPRHLEEVTSYENLMRGQGVPVKNKNKTHCPHGHEYSEENTHRALRKGRVVRWCKACWELRRETNAQRKTIQV